MKLERFLATGISAAAILLLAPTLVDALDAAPMLPGPRHEQHGAIRLVAQPLRELAQRSELRIGTAVDAQSLQNETTYRDTIAKMFSTVTPENVMKWDTVEPVQGQLDFSAGDQLVEFARSHGQLVRGHVLVWHSQLPSWLTSGTYTPDELRQIMCQHIQQEATHFRGKIWQWDVVNEAMEEDGTMRQSFWFKNLGPTFIADAFRCAHRADPKALLFYNDYNIEWSNPKSDAVYAMVKELVSQGVPIDGVGIQGHLDLQYPFSGPVSIAQNMQRFQDLGLFTAVTEADVRMMLPADDLKLEAQAAGYSAMLQGCLLTERCISFTVWGFTDAHSWVPYAFSGQGAANLLDENYQPKAGYEAVATDLALVKREHQP